MKLGEYIKKLQEIEVKYGSDMELIFARDIEGNSFEPVTIGPEAVFYSKDMDDIHETNEEYPANVVCIN